MSEPSTATPQDGRSAYRRLWYVLTSRSRLYASILVRNLRVGSSLPRQWRARYAQLRNDFERGDRVFHPSRMWSAITVLFRLILRGYGFEGFKRTVGRFHAAYEPGNPILLKALYHLYVSALEPRDEFGLLSTLEEPELGQGDSLLYRGRRLSLDLLQSIDEFYSLREAAGFARDDAVVFCEIGAGYGRLAHVVLSAMPNARYLIFDLPESLLLSEYYLTTLHPDRKAALYPDSTSVLASRDALAGHDLVFGLPHQVRSPGINGIDVFLNIYSFMEMRPDQIEEYFTIIDGHDPRAVYLKQHKREVNLFDKALISSDTYPIPARWARVFHRTATLYDHVFEAAYRVERSFQPASTSP